MISGEDPQTETVPDLIVVGNVSESPRAVNVPKRQTNDGGWVGERGAGLDRNVTEGLARRQDRNTGSTTPTLAARKAQKLASFFGTTRGEVPLILPLIVHEQPKLRLSGQVWRALHSELEATMTGEGKIDDDDEERREVLGGVSRPRRM